VPVVDLANAFLVGTRWPNALRSRTGNRGLQYVVRYEFQLIDEERHADAKTPLNGLPSREQPPGWLNHTQFNRHFL
jgi:hypothetical protein